MSETKECPFCAETIKAAARGCRFCGTVFPPEEDGGDRALCPPAVAATISPVITEADVSELLTGLVQKSLVVYEEDAQGHGRYRLLETVRQYARDRLAETEGGEALRSRHLRCFTTLAEQAEAEYWGPRAVEWLDRLETELDNLRAALEWGQERGAPSFAGYAPAPRIPGGAAEPVEEWLRLQAALPDFWLQRDHHREGRAWIDRAGTGVGFPPAVRAPLLFAVAHMRISLVDPAPAELADECLELCTELKDQRRIAWLLFQRAWVARWRGDPEGARAWSEKTLAVSRSIGADYVTAWCLLSLGTVESRTPEGLALLEESVAVARRSGNLWVQAWATRDLGHALFEHRQNERARALLVESCRLFQRVGCRWALTLSLESLGKADIAGGDLTVARRRFDDAIAIWHELGYAVFEADVLLNAGRVAREQGDLAAARAYFIDARRRAEEAGEPKRLAAALHNLGEIARLEKAYEEAGRLFEESLGLARQADDRRGILACLHKQAMVAQDQGEWARARVRWVELIAQVRDWDRQHVSRGAAWVSGPNPPPELLGALEGISRVWLRQGEARRAARLFGAVITARDARPLDLWGYQPSDHAPAESIVPALQAALGPERFEAAVSEGRSVTLAQAVAAALEEDEEGAADPS